MTLKYSLIWVRSVLQSAESLIKPIYVFNSFLCHSILGNSLFLKPREKTDHYSANAMCEATPPPPRDTRLCACKAAAGLVVLPPPEDSLPLVADLDNTWIPGKTACFAVSL